MEWPASFLPVTVSCPATQNQASLGAFGRNHIVFEASEVRLRYGHYYLCCLGTRSLIPRILVVFPIMG